MSEIKYLISDTSKQLGVEPHVLRYWEEELDMPIKRNEMGHRYYTEDDIRVLTNVRDMKEKGIQLKAIKHILNELYSNAEFSTAGFMENPGYHTIAAMGQGQSTADASGADKLSESIGTDRVSGATHTDQGKEGQLQTVVGTAPASMMSAELKMEQFQEIMFQIIARALEKNNSSLSGSISSEVSDKLSEAVSEAVTERVTEHVSERVSTGISERLSEHVSERVSASISEQLSENVSERVSASVSERITEDVSAKVSESVSDRVSGQVSDRVLKQMDYILRENEEREEERFRKLDEAIRQRQKANAEAAAALMEDGKKKKKKHRFGRKEKGRSRIFG